MLTASTGSRQLLAALLVFAGMAAAIVAVLGFEHIGGFIPCKLCLGQREPYYAAMPVAIVAALSAWRGWPACLTRGMLAIAGLLMVYAMALGVHHAGVEWGWWPGPGDCGGAAQSFSNTDDLLSSLTDDPPPACDEAAGRFLGLSFAGWNVLAALGLASIAFWGAFGSRNAFPARD